MSGADPYQNHRFRIEIDGITAALFVTDTSAGSSPLKEGSVEVAGAVTIVYATLPFAAPTATPVTVTTGGEFGGTMAQGAVAEPDEPPRSASLHPSPIRRRSSSAARAAAVRARRRLAEALNAEGSSP